MISYGGVYLLDDAEALDRVEAALSLDDLRDFARRTWPGRTAALGWPWLELETRPVLNRLVWPAGASRWSVGWFLTDDAGLGLIRPQAYAGVASGSGGGASLVALPFVMDDGRASIATDLFMLPPRPLYQVQYPTTPGNTLWLLTLVDQRFFFWEVAAAIAVATGGDSATDWPDLFDALGSALGLSLAVDDVPDAYLSPPADFNTFYELLPPQLDAAARSVGMKVYANLDGTVSVLSAETATDNLANNLEQFGSAPPTAAGGLMALVTGGANDLASVLPYSVTVAFPDLTTFAAPLWGSASVEVALGSLALPQYAGAATYPGTHLLRSSLPYGAENSDETDAYADQAASDWYAWRQAYVDEAFACVNPWGMGSFEDRVEWSHRRGEVLTRVQRPPWNERDEGPLLCQGQYGSITARPTALIAKVTEEIPALTVGPGSGGGVMPGMGTCTAYLNVGGQLLEACPDVPTWSVWLWQFKVGQWLELVLNGADGLWYAIGPPPFPFVTNVCAGGTGSGSGSGSGGGGGDCIPWDVGSACPGSCWPLTMHLTISGPCTALNGTYAVTTTYFSPPNTWTSPSFTYNGQTVVFQASDGSSTPSGVSVALVVVGGGTIGSGSDSTLDCAGTSASGTMAILSGMIGGPCAGDTLNWTFGP